MTAPLVPCANCAVLRGALEESRGQVRTLRLTLDQGVGELVAMQAECDALRVERDALRAAVRVCERAMLGEEGTDLSAAWADLHDLLPEEEP